MALLSIVTTLYKSEPYIEEFYKRATSSVTKISNDYEIIFVDDGSPDKSNEIVRRIIEKDKKVRLIELSKNFGHHKAILVGLEWANGDFIFLIDSDLEESPELLINFYKIMHEDLGNIDVVYGYLKNRKGNFFEKITGNIFYKLFNFLTDGFTYENSSVIRLMKRAYVKNLLLFKEAHVFFPGLVHLSGYKQIGVPVVKTSKGKTAYTFLKKLTMAVDAIVSFSNKPLIYISAIGMLISFISFFFLIFLIARKIIDKQVLTGWTSVMVSIWFIGGLIITSVGMVGVYIGRIFIQVKNRPNVIIRNVYN